MGNFVYDKIGKKAITIFLHAPWVSAAGYGEKPVYPVDGVIDAVMRELPSDYRRVGFDVNNTPFGDLPSVSSFYKYGYNDFKLEMFCDGYVYQKPFSEYEGVTSIKGFVSEDNIDYARSQSPNPFFRSATIEDFYNAQREDADIKRRLVHFH